MLRLEGCLRGNVPDNKQGLARACRRVCREHRRAASRRRSVYGPGTFINTAVDQIADQFTVQSRPAAGQAAAGGRGGPAAVEAPRRPARRAGRLARGGGARRCRRSSSSRTSSSWRSATGSRRAADQRPELRLRARLRPRAGQPGVPKSRFAYLFPSKNAALIQIRLRPDLTDAERSRAIDLIRTATAQKTFQPQEGARYIVTGVPVVTEGLADAVAELDLRAARRRAAPDGGARSRSCSARGCGCCRWRSRWRRRR